MQSCQFPFLGCPGTSCSRSGIQNHFSRIHWGDSILIPEEHPTPFPYYELCEWQVPPWMLKIFYHNNEEFRQGQEHQRCLDTLQRYFEANHVGIKVRINPLEAATEFPYLGRTITYNTSYWTELYSNLRKSQRRWGMVAKVMGNTGAPIKAQAMMYTEVAQAVLLYGR